PPNTKRQQKSQFPLSFSPSTTLSSILAISICSFFVQYLHCCLKYHVGYTKLRDNILQNLSRFMFLFISLYPAIFFLYLTAYFIHHQFTVHHDKRCLADFIPLGWILVYCVVHSQYPKCIHFVHTCINHIAIRLSLQLFH